MIRTLELPCTRLARALARFGVGAIGIRCPGKPPCVCLCLCQISTQAGWLAVRILAPGGSGSAGSIVVMTALALIVVLGDLRIHSFPMETIDELRDKTPEARAEFEIDPGGAFLHWPSSDTHMGIPQLLQQVDPSYYADLEIARYAAERRNAQRLRRMTWIWTCPGACVPPRNNSRVDRCQTQAHHP